MIPVDQADIAPSSALYVPQLEAVIAGDLVYNEIHQMLALAGPAEWRRWAASVAKAAGLQPKIVVAGHKKPEASDDNGRALLATTTEYIQAFARIAETALSPEDIIREMSERYPDHGNLATLVVSAQAAKANVSMGDLADPAGVLNK